MGGRNVAAKKEKDREALAERRPAVVMLAELRNFTRMSEMLDASRVLSLANDFFALTAGAVEANRGEVFAVQNDSLVAAFRDGDAAQFAPQAIAAAQQIQREFGALEEAWKADFGLQAAVAIGLHLGDTVFGVAGPKRDRQYVAFGDCVSIAERLMHRARAGEFVFSGPVAQVLKSAKFALEAQSLPPLELTRRPAIPIYGVLLDTRLDFT
jgi:adenylate cyclase